MKAYVLPESTPGKLQHLTIFIVSILCGLAVWAWASGSLFPSILFPGPQATLREGVRMLESGSIIVDAAVSLARIVAGFTIGSAIGIVVGLLIGYFPMVRTAFNPYLQFFRFVPPIAWVSPAMIWFGVGETSKIFIIVYGTVFTVALSAVAGWPTRTSTRFARRRCSARHAGRSSGTSSFPRR